MIRCSDCGHFISKPAHTNYIPLNEFGPEEIEHLCSTCHYKDCTQPVNPGKE